jgi:hypothetical protein
VPAELEAVVMRCLAKDAGDRFASMLELRRALRALELDARWTQADARRWWREHQDDTRQAGGKNC